MTGEALLVVGREVGVATARGPWGLIESWLSAVGLTAHGCWLSNELKPASVLPIPHSVNRRLMVDIGGIEIT